MFNNIVGIALNPLTSLNPALSVFLVGLFISLVMSLINKKFLGRGRAKEAKESMQTIRTKMLDAQKNGDTNKMNEHLSELMKINSEYFKFMLKPMIFSMIFVILLLPWLSSTYSGQIVATVPVAIPVVGGFEMSWFIWYFICTIVIGLVLRRMIGV